jgi:ribosomal protein S18 acetylase RimI-like enzyme
VAHDRHGASAGGFGDAARAAAMLAELAAGDRLHDARRWHLPRLDPATLAAARERDDWDFLSTRTPPPAVPGEDEVAPVDSDADVNALLDEAFPESFSRPGDTRVRAWFGIRERGRLVAVGADRSRAGVGMLAAIAVAPDRRGRGLGAALTAALTRRLLADHDVVALGVMTDNPGAARLYRGLGFGSTLPRTSLAVA